MNDPEEISVVVRVPLAKLGAEIRQKYSITIAIASISLEDDYLVFHFGGGNNDASKSSPEHGGPPEMAGPASVETVLTRPDVSDSFVRPKLRRRRRSSRNRMRTRGWAIVEKMTNSKGQTVTIYEPFVEALRRKDLRRREQEAVVSKILRDNGNRPGRVSIDYYLNNTLEYLARDAKS